MFCLFFFFFNGRFLCVNMFRYEPLRKSISPIWICLRVFTTSNGSVMMPAACNAATEHTDQTCQVFNPTQNVAQTRTLLTAPESAPDMKLMEKLACEAPECRQS